MAAFLLRLCINQVITRPRCELRCKFYKVFLKRPKTAQLSSFFWHNNMENICIAAKFQNLLN